MNVKSTLTTARCLYQVQCTPSTLNDSLYVLTLLSVLYRPWVATLVTAVISPMSIWSQWLLPLFGHQQPTCLPSLKRFSLASEGLWWSFQLLEAVKELSGIRLSSKPSDTEQLWTESSKRSSRWPVPGSQILYRKGKPGKQCVGVKIKRSRFLHFCIICTC